MKVEVLGPGCPRCEQTHRNIINAAAELGIAAEIDYITDVNAIAQRGMLRTPAVIVDGKVVIQGRIPSPREAKDLLTKYNK